MKFFIFSSPYQYYADNLIPVAKELSALGHEVVACYRLSETGSEFDMLTGKKVNRLSDRFFKGEKFDAVILTQTWWYDDLNISKSCIKNNIPFYVLEHATPMTLYTQKNGIKSHAYRAHHSGSKYYFSFGENNVNLMGKIGFAGKNVAVGSPRVEQMLSESLDAKLEPGTVLFDTSERMEDNIVYQSIEHIIRKKPNEKYIIRPHSRTSGMYNDLVNSSNVTLHTGKESELYKYTNFLFTFPSSAMIVPALLGRKIYAGYNNHFSKDARNFYEKYNNEIPAFGKTASFNYDKFISDNIVYSKKESAVNRIIKHIMDDLK